jgi:hypothetical protein
MNVNIHESRHSRRAPEFDATCVRASVASNQSSRADVFDALALNQDPLVRQDLASADIE